MKTEQRTAAVWAALSKIAGKEFLREQLPAASAHTIDLSITAAVDGKPGFQQHYTAMLTVCADGTRGSSQACEPARVIALLLDLVPKTKRETFLAELPAQFAAGDNALPDAPPALQEQAEKLLEKLRAHSTITIKGAVSVKHLPREAVPEGWPG
jgi:hypothetical protein